MFKGNLFVQAFKVIKLLNILRKFPEIRVGLCVLQILLECLERGICVLFIYPLNLKQSFH